MDKKSKVLTALSVIFTILAVAVFAFTVLFYASFVDVQTTESGGLGEAVAVSILVIFFLIAAMAHGVISVPAIVFSAVLIKRTAGKTRAFFIVLTAALGVMLVVTAVLFLTLAL